MYLSLKNNRFINPRIYSVSTREIYICPTKIFVKVTVKNLKSLFYRNVSLESIRICVCDGRVCNAKEMNCRNFERNEVCTEIPYQEVETLFMGNSSGNFISWETGSSRSNLKMGKFLMRCSVKLLVTGRRKIRNIKKNGRCDIFVSSNFIASQWRTNN